VSKKHGHSRKRRRKHKATPAALLAAIASALNDCERAGIPVRHPRVAVFTDYGVVMPFAGGWEARVFKEVPAGCPAGDLGSDGD
jgi:hypothetical protein